MAEQEDIRHSGVSRKGVLEKGELSVLKGRHELVVERGINITAPVVLLPLLRVISNELLIVEGGCPCRNGGHSTGVGHAEKE